MKILPSSAGRAFGAKAKSARGFSLIEILIVVAIIGILSAIVIARYATFNSTVLLKDLAYEIALSIREAQALGVSVRGEGTGDFDYAYGVYFDVNSNTYILFRDALTVNGKYDNGEEVSNYTVSQSADISLLCAQSLCDKAALHITFLRPEPDARIVSESPLANISDARIVISSGEFTHTVTVYNTGQISVE